VCFAAIEICDPPEPERLREAASRVGEYDWVLFTSANGVERFFAALRDLGMDARAFSGARIGVIGPKTRQALEAHGLFADLTAKEFIGEALAESLLAHGPVGRVLIPRALEAREALPELLRAQGASVDVVFAYETRRPPAERQRELAELLRSEVDVVLFTSSSTVDSVVAALGADACETLKQVTVAAIGPITQKTALDYGLRVDVTAGVYTVAGLLDALEEHFAACSPPALT
jgi:uroporphyrinogen III methyltransferase/synthase